MKEHTILLSTVDVDTCDLIGHYVIYQLDSYDISNMADGN